MLTEMVIGSVSIEGARLILLARKKFFSLRFCIAYRKLKAIMTCDLYPLLRMDDCIDGLGQATLLTTLVAITGHRQTQVDHHDRERIPLTSHQGPYRLIEMPFGLKSAPSAFQRATDIIPASVPRQFPHIYLEDIVVFLESMKDQT